MTSVARWVVLALVCMAWIAGCGKSGSAVKVYPVSGSVSVNGKAVEGAVVSFTAKGASPRVASGTTDAKGRFQLSTFKNNDGAVPGTHAVTIFKAGDSSKSGAGTIEDQGKSLAGGPGAGMSGSYVDMMKKVGKKKSTEVKGSGEIPEKYGNAATSGLERTVGESGNAFDFDLK